MIIIIQILNYKLTKQKFFNFFLIFFLYILSLQNLYAAEKIGTVVKVLGSSYSLNSDGEKKLLNIYDTIYLNEEISTNDRASLVIQYLDNTTIILKKSSNIKVTDFILTETKNLFLAQIKNGSAIIESGVIAKKDNGKMEVNLPTLNLNIKGTRFNIGQKENGVYDIALSEDSFGKVGAIKISSNSAVKTLYDPKQVISISSNEILERPQTNVEKNEIDEVARDFTDVKIINEEEIQKNLETKLINGNIIDLNNDGRIDLLDVNLIRENIVNTKQETINFIVENSEDDNIEFLSNVLNNSDEKNVGQSVDNIFETKNSLITGVLTGLSNTNNRFITSPGSQINNEIKDKIFTQLIGGNDEVEKKSDNIKLMGNIIAKSDLKSVINIVNIVKATSVLSQNSNLSLQILSSVADTQNEDAITLENEKQTEVNRLIEAAVAAAAANNNAENSALIANVITKSNVETITEVVDNIKKNNKNNPKAGLSLQVLNNVEITSAKASINIDSNKQTQINRLLEEALEAAAAEAAAILAAEEAASVAAALEAAAILAAEEATAAAAAALETEAILEAENELEEALRNAENLTVIANNLIQQCNVATTIFQNRSNQQILTTSNHETATEVAAAALLAWQTAGDDVINFISPVTNAEKNKYQKLIAKRNALKITTDQRADEARATENILNNSIVATTEAETNKITICAESTTALSEAISAQNAADAITVPASTL